jgi:hypothetical protein
MLPTYRRTPGAGPVDSPPRSCGDAVRLALSSLEGMVESCCVRPTTSTYAASAGEAAALQRRDFLYRNTPSGTDIIDRVQTQPASSGGSLARSLADVLAVAPADPFVAEVVALDVVVRRPATCNWSRRIIASLPGVTLSPMWAKFIRTRHPL